MGSQSASDEAYAAAYQRYVEAGFVHSDSREAGSLGWHSGLCDCLTDVPTCVLGCLCPCVVLGRNIEILDGGQTSSVAACLLWLIMQQLCLCGCLYSCWYRRRLRSLFRLPESPLCDCCVHCLCFPCAFCQEAREIDLRSKLAMSTETEPPARQRFTRTCSF